MKQFYCALVLALAPMTTYASAEETTLDARHYIYVEAKGTVTAPADHASILIDVGKKDQTPELAVDASIKAINDLLKSLTDLGIPRSDISTRNFVFETVYIKAPEVDTYQSVDPDRDKFDGYRVRNALLVTVRDLPRVGAVLAAAARQGAEVSKVEFGSFKSPEYLERARDIAARNAEQKARLYATSLNLELGDLLAMREGGGYSADSMEFPPVEGEADLMVIEVPIAPGVLEFTVDVSTKWEITDSAT
jgi:uncharacterized protein YggE